MTQARFRESLQRWRDAPSRMPEGRFEGRGIVICAGGERYFTCAWVLISILRHTHKCTLPIQVWHLGRQEMSEEMAHLLAEEGIEVVDAETIAARYPARLAGGWPIKPYAIAHSRFQEVLYLDADTVPLVDPQAAFAWGEYRDTGLLLWPDIADVKADNPAWARFGLEPRQHAGIDCGILLVDKARAWDVIDLAVLMNGHGDEIHDVLSGDKDTFLVSALYLGRNFALVPDRPFQFDWDMVQRDPAGDPFLHHRTGSKWLLRHENRPVSDAALMPACEAALAELRQRWSGVVFHAPRGSPLARAEEARLIAVRTFRYQGAYGDVRDIELLPGGRIGAGARLERNWAVTDRAGTLLLKFYAGHREYVTLERLDDGSWHGGNGTPGSDARLHEAPAAGSPETSGRPTRPAEDLVYALVHPALFAAGYDAARAEGLRAALTLLNDMYDDVPGHVRRQAARLRPPADWHGLLDRIAATLASARDRREALLPSDRMEPHQPGTDQRRPGAR